MAEDWLKWTYGLAGKREVRVIASRCHRDRHEIAGRVMTLWEWLEMNLSEADIDPETGDASLEIGEHWKQEIDEIAGLPNFAEVLASADVRWVIPARSGGRVTFPRLGRHVGKLAKVRAMEARKKSRQRRDKCPDETGTREEKRRDNRHTHTPREGLREPPTLEVVKAHADKAGIAPECAEKWYCLNEDRPLAPSGMWTTVEGHEMQNWQKNLQAYWIGWQQRGAKHGRHQRQSTGSGLRETTAGHTIREL